MSHDNKPLTVDQMREMHDKVVIVKTLEYGQESKGILDFSDPNDSDNGVYVGCSFYSVEHYGDWWLAYAQKPIDWDAWEPCNDCIECCSTCSRFIFDDIACQHCHSLSKYTPASEFCCWCGRPRTQSAREILERRLAGKSN